MKKVPKNPSKKSTKQINGIMSTQTKCKNNIKQVKSPKLKFESKDISEQIARQKIQLGKKEFNRNFQIKERKQSKLVSKEIKNQIIKKKENLLTKSKFLNKFSINRLNFDMNYAVTQQDIIEFGHQASPKNDQTICPIQYFSIQYKKIKLTQINAAVLIQKTWRGYQTRKLIAFYANLFKESVLLVENNNKQTNQIRQKYKISNSCKRLQIQELQQRSNSFFRDKQQNIYDQNQISCDRIRAIYNQQKQNENSTSNQSPIKVNQEHPDKFNISKIQNVIQLPKLQKPYSFCQNNQYQININNKDIQYLQNNTLSTYNLIDQLAQHIIIYNQSISSSESLQSLHLPNNEGFDQKIIDQFDDKLKYKNQQEKCQKINDFGQKVQEYIFLELLDQLYEQIYQNQNLYRGFHKFLNINQIYHFHKIEDFHLQNFLKQIQLQLLSTYPNFLQLLNRKNYVSSQTVLKHLSDFLLVLKSDLCDFIIPQQVLRDYNIQNEKVNEIYKNILVKQKQFINSTNLVKVKEKIQKVIQKKQSVLKSEKQLQNLYFQSVFHSFNESVIKIIQTYSGKNKKPLLATQLICFPLYNTNTDILKQDIHPIISKSKSFVLQIIRQKCPILSIQEHKNLKLVESHINKQIKYQINQNEYKWFNYYEQTVSILIKLSSQVENFLMEELMKEIALQIEDQFVFL